MAGRGERLLGQTGGAQYTIRLDDPLQPFLGAPVAAVRVGVKSLHEFLIPRLYLVQVCICVKIEHFQRNCLWTRELSFRTGGGWLFFAVAEDSMSVVNVVKVLSVAKMRRSFAQRPGWPMPDNSFNLEGTNFLVAHAAKIIPVFIVSASVLQTKPDMFVQLLPAPRNPIFSFSGASLRGAGTARRRICPDIRIDPDVLTKTRPVTCLNHGAIMGPNR